MTSITWVLKKFPELWYYLPGAPVKLIPGLPFSHTGEKE